MAGDWIKMRTDLDRDPAVIQLAEHYGWPEHCICGLLYRLWSWADGQLADGIARGVTSTFVDRFLGVNGFSLELAKVGWLILHEDGLEFPLWDRHNSASAKRRALANQRKAVQRGAVTQMSRSERDISVTKTRPEKRREEKRREEERKKKEAAGPLSLWGCEIPENLRTEAFTASWIDWVQHRREIRKPLTKQSVKKQLQQLADVGPADAVAMINYTISKGWQGLRAPEAATAAKGQQLRLAGD